MSKSQLKKQAARMFNIETEAYQIHYDKRIEELAKQPRKRSNSSFSLFAATAILSAHSMRF